MHENCMYYLLKKKINCENKMGNAKPVFSGNKFTIWLEIISKMLTAQQATLSQDNLIYSSIAKF